jgi:hypothetical protein
VYLLLLVLLEYLGDLVLRQHFLLYLEHLEYLLLEVLVYLVLLVSLPAL